MFFSRPQLYLYRKRNALVIYTGKDTESVAKIEIPQDVEKAQEILNPAKFQGLISDQVRNHILKGQKVIILLSNEIIFQKKSTNSDAQTQDDKIQSFLEDVPFDRRKIANIQIETREGLLLVAANRDLFDPIIKVLDEIGAQTTAVLPSTLFTSREEVSQELFLNIKKNSQLIKKGNLLNLQAKQEKIKIKAETKAETKREALGNNNRQTKLLIVAVALIVFGVVAIAYYVATQFVFKKPRPVPATQNQTQAPVISSQESTDTPQPSAPQESTATP